MNRILRIEDDPGLLTNRRMSLEIGVGLATLTGRRLSMSWSDPIGDAPGPGPARRPKEGSSSRDVSRPTMLDLWDVPIDPIADEEWSDAVGEQARTLDWGSFTECVYLAGPDKVPRSSVIDFANGRTRFVRVPVTDERVIRVLGRPLSWFSYFFYATGDTRRRLLDAVSAVRLRAPFRDFAAQVARDLGSFNVAHVRRTDMVRGIRAYAGVSPARIAATLSAMLPPEETLVVATEADPRSALFDPIRERFRDVVFLSDLILADHAAGFEALPFHEDNALGAITQAVATGALRFVGTLGSTFSGLIHRERCRLNPSEPFSYTADFTPPGPQFLDGQFVETRDGRYTWNRIGIQVSPGVLAWLREWPEAVTSPDDEPGGDSERRDRRDEMIHAVVCTDTNPYGDWQCRLQEHTWAQAGQPGELVRLVACPNDEATPRHQRVRVVKTKGTNNHPRVPDDHYAGFNRLWSLLEWLHLENPEGTILILDSDFVFRAAVHETVQPGEIVAQEWFAFSVPDSIAPSVAVATERVRPFTWPFLVDAGDLAALLPRWIEMTAELRASCGIWEADMYGLLAAVGETDLTVRYETLGAWMNWPEDFVAGAPIIHYCQPVAGKDGTRLWYKQDYRPWEDLGIDPNDAALDYCRDLLHLLDQFIGLKAGER